MDRERALALHEGLCARAKELHEKANELLTSSFFKESYDPAAARDLATEGHAVRAKAETLQEVAEVISDVFEMWRDDQ